VLWSWPARTRALTGLLPIRSSVARPRSRCSGVSLRLDNKDYVNSPRKTEGPLCLARPHPRSCAVILFPSPAPIDQPAQRSADSSSAEHKVAPDLPRELHTGLLTCSATPHPRARGHHSPTSGPARDTRQPICRTWRTQLPRSLQRHLATVCRAWRCWASQSGHAPPAQLTGEVDEATPQR
jgi:hypothetical protein